MVEHKLHLLLGGEVVQGPGGEVVEGVVGGAEDGHALVGVVDLAVDLAADLGDREEVDPGVVLAGLHEDLGDVDRARRGGRGGGGLGEGLGGEEEGEEEREEERERCESHCGGGGGKS